MGGEIMMTRKTLGVLTRTVEGVMEEDGMKEVETVGLFLVVIVVVMRGMKEIVEENNLLLTVLALAIVRSLEGIVTIMIEVGVIEMGTISDTMTVVPRSQEIIAGDKSNDTIYLHCLSYLHTNICK